MNWINWNWINEKRLDVLAALPLVPHPLGRIGPDPRYALLVRRVRSRPVLSGSTSGELFRAIYSVGIQLNGVRVGLCRWPWTISAHYGSDLEIPLTASFIHRRPTKCKGKHCVSHCLRMQMRAAFLLVAKWNACQPIVLWVLYNFAFGSETIGARDSVETSRGTRMSTNLVVSLSPSLTVFCHSAFVPIDLVLKNFW